MSATSHGICDHTHAVHQAAHDFLFSLILDLDFVRIGQAPLSPITDGRLASWCGISEEVWSCQRLHFWKLGQKGHEPELAWGNELVRRLADQLKAGQSPALPESHKDWLSMLRRFLRCEESHKR